MITQRNLSKYNKLYPSHQHLGLLAPNQVRPEMQELKVYKLIKTWSG